MPVKIGLTGSIGMGKSTTAKMFADQGCAVWDADGAVHRLYAPGGAAVRQIDAVRPEAVHNGKVDRAALKAWMAEDADALSKIEDIVHPLVRADRARFVADAVAPVVVLDIPLLFETDSQDEMDVVVVVSTSPEIQKERVLRRPDMTEEIFARLLAKQMPDAEKRARADHVIDTTTMETARADVAAVMRAIEKGSAHA